MSTENTTPVITLAGYTSFKDCSLRIQQSQIPSARVSVKGYDNNNQQGIAIYLENIGPKWGTGTTAEAKATEIALAEIKKVITPHLAEIAEHVRRTMAHVDKEVATSLTDAAFQIISDSRKPLA